MNIKITETNRRIGNLQDQIRKLGEEISAIRNACPHEQGLQTPVEKPLEIVWLSHDGDGNTFKMMCSNCGEILRCKVGKICPTCYGHNVVKHPVSLEETEEFNKTKPHDYYIIQAFTCNGCGQEMRYSFFDQ